MSIALCLDIALMKGSQIDHIIDVHPSRLHDALQKAPMDVSIAARQLDQAYESRMQREQVDTLGWECSRCLFGRLQWLGRADVMAHMQSKYVRAHVMDLVDDS